MKATELRIGNWVYNTGDTQTFVDADIIHDIDLADKGSGNFRYTPIPLTEEWLVKFGFIETSYGWESAISTIEIVGKKFIQSRNGVVIKYVHSLQNLYFALNGEELTWN